MRYKKSNNSAPLFTVTHLVLILLCIVLVTLHISSGIYAKYSTSSSASASGRVIYFGDIAIEEPSDNDLTLIPGVSAKKQAFLSFDGSEAQTYVFVVIRASEQWSCSDHSYTALGSQISISVSDEWTYLKSEGNDAVFYRSLSPNVKIEGSPIFADGGRITVGRNIKYSELSTMTGSTMSVKAIAVQGNGFENVSDAWTSVSSKVGGN